PTPCAASRRCEPAHVAGTARDFRPARSEVVLERKPAPRFQEALQAAQDQWPTRQVLQGRFGELIVDHRKLDERFAVLDFKPHPRGMVLLEPRAQERVHQEARRLALQDLAGPYDGVPGRELYGRANLPIGVDPRSPPVLLGE